MTTLVSFLGKGRADAQSGYRTAHYLFADGHLIESAFFGLALTNNLTPDRLVLVGTPGSMWDVFFDAGAHDDDAIELTDAVANENVTTDMLEAFNTRLARKLGLPVSCLLIPYARNAAEQVAVLEVLSGAFKKGEAIWLDVTHGFRHLPMLALVAARYLTHVVGVRVSEIFYGAFDMTSVDGKTPVLQLSGLMTLLDWVEALAKFDHSGDYGLFAAPLANDGFDPDRSSQLERAAFFERTGNPVKARESLFGVFSAIESHQGVLGKLFGPALIQRIRWSKQARRADWERSLADDYLARGDYLRATTYLFEAFVTRAAEKRGDTNDFETRDAAGREACENQSDAKALRRLRNALVHGVRPVDARVTKHLSTAALLRAKLKDLRSRLFE